MPPMQKNLPDLTPVFARYETLCHEADALFNHVRAGHQDCVTCAQGCSDCCHALFDLSLVEAAYLHQTFVRTFPLGPERSALLEAADAADRAVHKIKRRAFNAAKEGQTEDTVLADLARERVRCPLLDSNNRCSLYDARPITCRVYGVPTAIAGKGYTCGQSKFIAGQSYPTVNMDGLRGRLADLSLDLARHVHSRYTELHTVLVPVSMALLTEYDAEYFGAGGKP